MNGPAPIPAATNRIGRLVVDAAVHVHQALGAGLLESAYQACLAEELRKMELHVLVEVGLPVVYGDVKLDVGYRIDLLVEGCVVVEVKAVDAIHPVHVAQVLTYLKLSERRLGYLLNFNVALMKEGVRRLVL